MRLTKVKAGYPSPASPTLWPDQGVVCICDAAGTDKYASRPLVQKKDKAGTMLLISFAVKPSTLGTHRQDAYSKLHRILRGPGSHSSLSFAGLCSARNVQRNRTCFISARTRTKTPPARRETQSELDYSFCYPQFWCWRAAFAGKGRLALHILPDGPGRVWKI